ncbi:AbiV family abortive infection protein [Nitrospira sp. Ecomares 2.1]
MEPTRYNGPLDAAQAAAAMQAARLNSIDLLESAEILFELKRFGHSIPLSILAIEEAGKLPLLQAILLAQPPDLAKLWRKYRNHRPKTEPLNLAIQSRIRVEFPNLGKAIQQQVANQGPTPDQLESQKQRAVYSDCHESGAQVICHLPRNVDWRQIAWERLCEARAIVFAPRDRSPEELEIWQRVTAEASISGRTLSDVLPEIHQELLSKGFIREGWWDTLLADLEEGQSDA